MTTENQERQKFSHSKNLILVVDDTPVNVDLLDNMLTERGYNVIGTTKGRFAITVAKEKQPDLILLDIRMPEMDGYEVCQTLKLYEKTKAIPVIIISALGEADEKVKAFQMGAVDYITKPFQEEEVLMRIQTHLELKQMRDNLEVLVAQRTTELEKSEEKLRQAQKMEAIGTLAGGIAHDFNNILSIIFGYTELAIDDINDNPDDMRMHLDQVVTAASRAKDLVNQILTFSRMTEQEKVPLRPSVIIKESLKLLRSSIPSTITINQYIKSSQAILADATQISQIVMNLCTNAYHAIGQGGGTISVKLQDITITKHTAQSDPLLSPGKYCCIEISDTGFGMDEITLKRVFDPYFTTKEKGEGTGLGLAVVHGIVKSHNGFVQVTSTPGDGTTFQIYLPVLESKDSLVQRTERTIKIEKGSERVLFVDDEEKIVAIAKRMLTKNGYKVTTYTNSKEALISFQSNPSQFDLVITDFAMPELNGADLSKQIRSIRSDIPILVCSGNENLAGIADMEALNLSRLTKPIIMSDLLKTIQHLLKGGKNHP